MFSTVKCSPPPCASKGIFNLKPGRLLLNIVLGLFFLLGGATDLYAAKQIGVIMTGDVPYYGAMHEAFVAELGRKFGGRDKVKIILQRPFPNPISWSNAARKLIAFDVDLIVAYGLPAAQAVLHEKSRIPLVYAGLYEPDHASLAGGNVTGCGFRIPLSSIIRYFKGLRPTRSIGVVFSGLEEDSLLQYQTMQTLAAQQGIETVGIDLRSRADLERLKSVKADAVFISGSSLAHVWLADILAILAKRQIPAADIFSDDASSGVLMTLYQPPAGQGEAAADMAARILAGTRPGTLAPQTFRETELVLNLVEARRLGITFPIHLLVEATRVIK
jgi:putative tryptophan/tyrosine transport system substrate-binding protein